MSISASGQFQFIGGRYVSTNYGITWSRIANTGVNVVAVSATGQYLVSIYNGGYIYTSVTPYSNLAASNQITVSGNTASISTATGALVVGGGAGASP